MIVSNSNSQPYQKSHRGESSGGRASAFSRLGGVKQSGPRGRPESRFRSDSVKNGSWHKVTVSLVSVYAIMLYDI